MRRVPILLVLAFLAPAFGLSAPAARAGILERLFTTSAASKGAKKDAKAKPKHHHRRRHTVRLPHKPHKDVPLPKAVPDARPAKADAKTDAKADAKAKAKSAATKPKPAETQSIAARSAPAESEKQAETTGAVATPPPRPDDIAPPQADMRAGIPAGERLRIQSALMWAGDYDGAGKTDAPLTAAVKNFQKRHKEKVTGVLTVKQRAALLAAGDRYVRRFGWRVVTDPATGIRIGLPTKLTPAAHDAAHGTRWTSPNGAMQIETFRLKDPHLTLKDLYARERKTPSTRRVSRHTLNDHDFALHGMQRLKYFDVHAEQRDGEIRGYTLLYDQAMNGIVAPVVNAMAAAFAPFPARAMPFAVLARPVEYGTGLIVGARGDIVTDRQVTDGCKVIVAAGLGSAERVAEDKAQGLALLRVYGQRDLPALPLPRDVAKTKESRKSLTLIGIPDPHDQQGAHSPKEFKARLASGGAVDLRQPVPMAGLSGGAVLDDAGHVVGMMGTRNAVLASNGPPLAPVHLVTTATIRDFLHAHDVTTATSGNARDALVRVICVRK
ncbi:MAG: serine protease [Pseudolabrys sp.]